MSQAGSLLLTAALLTSNVVSPVLAADPAGDERIERLPPEQKALAQRMTSFIVRMDEKYFPRIASLNGGIDGDVIDDVMIMESEYSDYDIRVTRGPVIEKAGRMLSVGKKTSPARGPDNGPLIWGRFYSLDIHPKTPLVGMLHATIVLQFFDGGKSAVGGWLDVMPGTRVEEDIDRLHALVDAHFAAHQKDPTLYRKLMCKGTAETVAQYRRKPSCSGVSFYGPPVYRADTERSYAFIEALFDSFVDTYLDIAADRADDAYTDADIMAQDAMRKRWLIDQLFSDPYSSSVVPFEAWFMANVPPVIKF
jgi:coproporphyrinogen III oxidase